jgi:polar amino acid transport system substrate-binding protein
LEILLVEKAPYYYPDGRNPHGFLYSRFACIMHSAKIPVSFHFQPINRVLHRIKTDKKACSLGWFRIPIRESYATFSEGLWDDKPMGLVVHKDAALRFAAYGSLEKMLATPGLKAVMPENVSFGQTLDRMLSRSKHEIQISTINFVQSLTMVASKRVDYTIANIPEYNWHRKLEKERFGRDVIEMIRYSDMPEGEQRYLMCHRDFDRRELEAINQAIRQFKADCSLQILAPD